MTNNLTNAGDGFGVPENSGNQFIVGKMMKFADGEYIVDKTEPLPADIELVALAVTTVTIGMHLTVAGDTMLDRLAVAPVHPGDLPDLDEAEWPLGLDGKPADPWKDTRYLIDPRTGMDYTFVTDTHGGRRGVGNLKSQIMNVRMAYPDAVPLVNPATAPFKTSFGMKKRPDFKVIGWRNRKGGPTVKDLPPKPLPKLDAQQTFDDSIPL